MNIHNLWNRNKDLCRDGICAGVPGIISLQKDPEGKQSQMAVLGFDRSLTEIILNRDGSTTLKVLTPEGRELPPLHGHMGKEFEF